MTLPPAAAPQGLASCHTCGKVSAMSPDGDPTLCPRCATPLHLRKPHSLQRTWAFLLAAAVLYIPANLLPIMEVSSLKGAQSSTILSGVITFWQMGAYPVAIIIFTASVLIPLLKVAALVWLCLAAQGRAGSSPEALSRIYHITELLGRWSMVDVFVVAVLVCLVRLGALMTITPGPAAVSFSGVVILTMFSAMSFDPRLIWDRHRLAMEESGGGAPAPDSPGADGTGGGMSSGSSSNVGNNNSSNGGNGGNSGSGGGKVSGGGGGPASGFPESGAAFPQTAPPSPALPL